MDACPICQVKGETLKKCSGCLAVSYCSPAHQKLHWKIHKNDCCPFKITHDPILGKQLVASRDLKPGTVVLNEKPIITRPYFDELTRVCLACGLHFDGETPRLCSTCNWPICSAECEQTPMHKDNECGVFASQKVECPLSSDQLDKWCLQKFLVKINSSPNNQCSMISMIIELIRAFGLKKRNPTTYKELLNESYNLKPMDQESDADAAKELERLFRKLINVNKLGVKFNSREFVQLHVAMKGNNFSCKSSNVMGIYLKASRLNHSCSANCDETMVPFPLSCKITTITLVKRGEPLTYNYFDVRFQCSSRRQRLDQALKKWFFLCHCPRCLDPSELGTFSDAITCSKCRPDGQLVQQQPQYMKLKENGLEIEEEDNLGYYLPVEPLDLKVSAQWMCNLCKATKPYRVINKISDTVRKKLDNIGRQGFTSMIAIEYLERLLEGDSKKLLHPNHWIFISAASQITILLHQEHAVKRNISRTSFDKLIKYRLYRLAIESKFAPGISLIRANSLSQLSIWIYNNLQAMPMKFSKDEKLALLTSALGYQKEAAKFYDMHKILDPSHRDMADQLARLNLGIEGIMKSV